MPEKPTGTPCATCERLMVAQVVFRADPDRWRAQGVVQQGAGDDCHRCYMRRRREDAPLSNAKPPRSPIDPAVVAQLRAAAGLPPGGAS
jgi:hypothetical protein